MQRFALHGARNLCPQGQFRRAFNIKRAEHRGGGGACRQPVIYRIHQHGNAKRIRQQDEFLALAIAHMADACQEADRGLPFLEAGFNIAHKGMKMLH